MVSLAHDNYLMVIDVLNYGLLTSWKKKLAKDTTGIHVCNYKYNFKIPSMTKEASQLAYCKNILCEVCSANIRVSVWWLDRPKTSKCTCTVSLFRLIWHEKSASSLQRALKARQSRVSSSSHWCKWSEAENEKKMVFLICIIFLGQPTSQHMQPSALIFLLTYSIFCPKKGKFKLRAGVLGFLRDIKAK